MFISDVYTSQRLTSNNRNTNERKASWISLRLYLQARANNEYLTTMVYHEPAILGLLFALFFLGTLIIYPVPSTHSKVLNF